MKNTIIKIFEDPSGTECFYGNKRISKANLLGNLNLDTGIKKTRHTKMKKHSKEKNENRTDEEEVIKVF